MKTNWFTNGIFNWKTTGAAIIGGIATLLGAFHVVNITADQQATIFAATLIFVGFFSKDSNTVGTIETQPDEALNK